MSDEPVGAAAFGFFVGDSEKNYVAVELNLFALQHHHHDKLRETFIFHVLRAASPEPAVFDFPAERWNLPVGCVAGDDIHVVEQDERTFALRRGSRQAGPQISASRGVFEDAILDSFLVENFLVKRHRAHLMAGRVGGVDAQVLLHPGDCEIRVLL